MKRGRTNLKKAQTVLGMSFGVIFSLIIIIFIIVITIVVILHLLETRDCGKIGIFKKDFENNVKDAWEKNTKSDFEIKENLPTNLDYLCFFDPDKSINGKYEDIGKEISFYDEFNIFLYPLKNACDMAYFNNNHLDINKITSNENPYCIPIKNGAINLKIKIDYDESLVSIE